MFLDVTDGCKQKSVKNVYNKNSKWWIGHTWKWLSLIYYKYQLFSVIFSLQVSPDSNLFIHIIIKQGWFFSVI